MWENKLQAATQQEIKSQAEPTILMEDHWGTTLPSRASKAMIYFIILDCWPLFPPYFQAQCGQEGFDITCLLPGVEGN